MSEIRTLDSTRGQDDDQIFAYLIGTFRRIGPYGPSYEVVAIIDEDTARIALLETGEEVQYSVQDILGDPDPDDVPPVIS